jgi:hypothetical protein
VTIQFPWASLLRGTLALDAAAAAGIADLLTPVGLVTALVATALRDRLAGVPTASELLDGAGLALADRWRPLGLRLTDLRAVAPAEVTVSGSSWARRLLADGGRGRHVVSITLSRP